MAFDDRTKFALPPSLVDRVTDRCIRQVLIARSTGTKIPTVGRLGESELYTGMFPTGDQLRTGLKYIAESLTPKDWTTMRGLVPKSGAELADVDWLGEVVGQSSYLAPSLHIR